jgi:hypothetical protein
MAGVFATVDATFTVSGEDAGRGTMFGEDMDVIRIVYKKSERS